MKRIFSAVTLLSCSLFLGGCMLRATGPCLGYGCPAMSGKADSYHAQAASPQASTAKKYSPRKNPAFTSATNFVASR